MTKCYDLPESPLSTTVTVSIGRNLPTGGKLENNTWNRFQDRTQAVVLGACSSFDDVHFTGQGQGWYKGQSEESFTIVATVAADLVPELQARLRNLAVVFGQESIAVTAGTTTLVEAR